MKNLILLLIALLAISVAHTQPCETKILPSDGDVAEFFGRSVSISGDLALVGSDYDNAPGYHSGSAFIFRRSGTSWIEEAKLLPSDAAPYKYFGYSVSLDGDKAIVGAYGDDDNGPYSGSAYIFTRSGTSWTEEAKLVSSDIAYGDHFGYSVCLSGDLALIGAVGDDDNGGANGSAYIFKKMGSSWTEEAKLTASDGDALDIFGRSVHLDGDLAIVGNNNDDDNGPYSGSAYIFTRSGTSWTEEAKLTASDATVEGHFGRSVSIDGNVAIVGAFGDADNGNYAGAAYIFRRNGASWTEEAKLLASDGTVHGQFGISVSLEGDVAIIGAPGDHENGYYAGAAYVFRRNGASWTEDLKLLASDGSEYNYFFIVSVDGGSAIVGAFGDDDNGIKSGSAYIYHIAACYCELEAEAGDCQVAYYGYGPMECDDLTATTLNGTPPYTFEWMVDGAVIGTDEVITVCPTADAQYTLIVTDAAGCTATDDVMVKVVDVRCGNQNDKVLVCHVPPGNPGGEHNICISESAVPAHLAHGDYLSICGADDPCDPDGPMALLVSPDHSIWNSPESTDPSPGEFTLYPNPTASYLTVVQAGVAIKELSIFSLQGQRLWKADKLFSDHSRQIDIRALPSGTYLVLAVAQTGERYTKWIVKME